VDRVDVTLEAAATVLMNSVLVQSAGDGDSRWSIRALQEVQKQESGVQHAARPHKAQSPLSLTNSDFRLSRLLGRLQLESGLRFKDTEALAFGGARSVSESLLLEQELHLLPRWSVDTVERGSGCLSLCPFFVPLCNFCGVTLFNMLSKRSPLPVK